MPNTEVHVREVPEGALAVNPDQAARLLGIAKSTCYEWIYSGQLPSVKVGGRRLISIAALRALVEPED